MENLQKESILWINKGIKKSIKLKKLYYKNFMKPYNVGWYTKYKQHRDKLKPFTTNYTSKVLEIIVKNSGME